MKVKFKVSGKVGINRGLDGTIEVKEGEVREFAASIAGILIDQNIAVHADGEKEAPAAVVAEEKSEELEHVAEVIVEDLKEKPKKRGRKKGK